MDLPELIFTIKDGDPTINWMEGKTEFNFKLNLLFYFFITIKENGSIICEIVRQNRNYTLKKPLSVWANLAMKGLV